MNPRIAVVLILAAGYAMSSEPNDGDKQEPPDLPDDIKQELMDLSDTEKQELAGALGVFVGSMQLIEGHRQEPMAQRLEREFLQSDDTEWWGCDDAMRFVLHRGCAEDECPVRLAANRSLVLGRVMFAGDESYAQYNVQGLEREWHWCLQDDNRFGCSFVLRAGGDGVYYDFSAPSTTTRSDGHEIAQPAGRFKCDRFYPSD